MSPPLVSSALVNASTLANLSRPSESQIVVLQADIERAYNAFVGESSRFAAADRIERGLLTSLYFARASVALSGTQVPVLSVRTRLAIIVQRLRQVRDLMQSPGAGGAPSEPGGGAGTAAESLIGIADTRSGASFAPRVAPSSMGVILGDPNLAPLAAQAVSAPAQIAGSALPYELAGASVTVGGHAAALYYVSPSRVSFYVPQEIVEGEAEVIVTSQDGYVSRGTITVGAVAPGLFTASGSGSGDALAMNASTYLAGAFDVLTQKALGNDKRTRLMLFTTGIAGGGAANFDPSNDVRTAGGMEIRNYAESVTVEARAADGRTFHLPVEFAGWHGDVGGLEQVTFMLPEALRGAGRVGLTLLVGGQVSNTASVVVR